MDPMTIAMSHANFGACITSGTIHHKMHAIGSTSSSFGSFTHFCFTCVRMPLAALSLWPGRQPCRPRLVDGRRGGGPSAVSPRNHNPPNGHICLLNSSPMCSAHMLSCLSTPFRTLPFSYSIGSSDLLHCPANVFDGLYSFFMFQLAPVLSAYTALSYGNFDTMETHLCCVSVAT